jgi:predicted GIY-YIG superfamily endonuclease
LSLQATFFYCYGKFELKSGISSVDRASRSHPRRSTVPHRYSPLYKKLSYDGFLYLLRYRLCLHHLFNQAGPLLTGSTGDTTGRLYRHKNKGGCATTRKVDNRMPKYRKSFIGINEGINKD